MKISPNLLYTILIIIIIMIKKLWIEGMIQAFFSTIHFQINF